MIARRLIAELPKFGAPGRKEIAALAGLCGLAGLAPWTRQSGRWKGKSVIGGGRAWVRAALFMGALFMGALVAARYNPALKAFSQRLDEAGKPNLVVIIAVARKLSINLNAVPRDK